MVIIAIVVVPAVMILVSTGNYALAFSAAAGINAIIVMLLCLLEPACSNHRSGIKLPLHLYPFHFRN